MAAPGKWTPRDATDRIRTCANNAAFTPHWKRFALECLHERDLIVGDVLHALREGMVLDEPTPSDLAGYFRYTVESKVPNGEGRTLTVVVVPGHGCELKIIRVTWSDEQ
ncbi:MAG: DUF4258 domain-containing protein [Phenylobacterium sp.]|jgi:hypothetical protein|uniref:DUF4258 domain-containing protein n=1 Tax=Phenylobacterium sp. TaxID=1871053 RepID=UPI0012133E26|nr:DUF4258 domain-containing protein [Phenylobacterium sp.]TAJ73709.1 MAG: DUF4258 domain-containing protein [Phenylobacterium sp.]